MNTIYLRILLWSIDIRDYGDDGLVGDLCKHFRPTVQQLDETLPLLDELVGYLLEIILHGLCHDLNRATSLLCAN